MKKTTLSILSVTAIALSVSSCYNDNFKELHPQGSTCDTSNTVTYQNSVKAVIDANCISCHSPAGGTQPYLNTYQLLSAYSSDQLLSVLATNAAKPMPPSSPLSSSDVGKITQWVSGCRPFGAASNTTCDTSAAMSYSLNIEPILIANCTNGCHDGVGYGHSMLTCQDIYANGDTALVTTGIGPSYLERSLITSNPSKVMPLGRPALSACQIAKIRRWVKEGSLDN